MKYEEISAWLRKRGMAGQLAPDYALRQNNVWRAFLHDTAARVAELTLAVREVVERGCNLFAPPGCPGEKLPFQEWCVPCFLNHSLRPLDLLAGKFATAAVDEEPK